MKRWRQKKLPETKSSWPECPADPITSSAVGKAVHELRMQTDSLVSSGNTSWSLSNFYPPTQPRIQQTSNVAEGSYSRNQEIELRTRLILEQEKLKAAIQIIAEMSKSGLTLELSEKEQMRSDFVAMADKLLEEVANRERARRMRDVPLLPSPDRQYVYDPPTRTGVTPYWTTSTSNQTSYP